MTIVCCCENIEHDSPNESIHPMFAETPEGFCTMDWVGKVCNDCAVSHSNKGDFLLGVRSPHAC